LHAVNLRQKGIKIMPPRTRWKKSKADKVTTPLSERSIPSLILDLLLEALRISDDRLNKIAAEILSRFEEQPIKRLVLEAASSKNRPAHRIRLLRVIATIGIGSDPSNFYDLGFIVTHEKNAAVRAAAAEVICNLQQRRQAATSGADPGIDSVV
jgi:hypothetical protein